MFYDFNPSLHKFPKHYTNWLFQCLTLKIIFCVHLKHIYFELMQYLIRVNTVNINTVNIYIYFVLFNSKFYYLIIELYIKYVYIFLFKSVITHSIKLSCFPDKFGERSKSRELYFKLLVRRILSLIFSI